MPPIPPVADSRWLVDITAGKRSQSYYLVEFIALSTLIEALFFSSSACNFQTYPSNAP